MRQKNISYRWLFKRHWAIKLLVVFLLSFCLFHARHHSETWKMHTRWSWRNNLRIQQNFQRNWTFPKRFEQTDFWDKNRWQKQRSVVRLVCKVEQILRRYPMRLNRKGLRKKKPGGCKERHRGGNKSPLARSPSRYINMLYLLKNGLRPYNLS